MRLGDAFVLDRARQFHGARDANLPGIQRERERDVAGGGFEIIDEIADDLVHAYFLSINLRLMRIAFEPRAVLCAAG